MSDDTIFDGDDYCEVCGYSLYDGRCAECEGPLETPMGYAELPHTDWRAAWIFAGLCGVPLSLMVFSKSPLAAAVIGLIALVVGVGCKLGLQYRDGAAADSPQQGARR